jgi:hypothetical protein
MKLLRSIIKVMPLVMLLALIGSAAAQEAGVLSQELENEIRQTVRDYLTHPTEVSAGAVSFSSIYVKRHAKEQELEISATWTTQSVGKHLLGVIRSKFGVQLRGLDYKTVTLDLAGPFIWKLDLKTGKIVTLPK